MQRKANDKQVMLFWQNTNQRPINCLKRRRDEAGYNLNIYCSTAETWLQPAS